MKSKSFVACVRADHHRHTCIDLARENGHAVYIALNTEGLEVSKMEASEFENLYQVLKDYPVERAAKLYAEYAANVGGTKEAMRKLAELTPLKPSEIEMATTKKAATAAAKAKPAAKAAPAKTAKPAAKAKPEAKATKAKPVAKETKTEKKPSAAQMFKDLIMEGKLSDDKIFEKVQKEFGLDDNKRGYVKWYRNDLVKKGLTPPEAK